MLLQQAMSNRTDLFSTSEKLASTQAALEEAQRRLAGVGSELDATRRRADKAEQERQAALAR